MGPACRFIDKDTPAPLFSYEFCETYVHPIGELDTQKFISNFHTSYSVHPIPKAQIAQVRKRL